MMRIFIIIVQRAVIGAFNLTVTVIGGATGYAGYAEAYPHVK